MKTLVNKANPQIRITAPEIGTGTHGYYYVGNVGYHKDKWTLVEEEPTGGIKGNLEEIPSNVDLDELALEEYPVVKCQYQEQGPIDINISNRIAYRDGLKKGYELGRKGSSK